MDVTYADARGNWRNGNHGTRPPARVSSSVLIGNNADLGFELAVSLKLNDITRMQLCTTLD